MREVREAAVGMILDLYAQHRALVLEYLPPDDNTTRILPSCPPVHLEACPPVSTCLLSPSVTSPSFPAFSFSLMFFYLFYLYNSPSHSIAP